MLLLKKSQFLNRDSRFKAKKPGVHSFGKKKYFICYRVKDLIKLPETQPVIPMSPSGIIIVKVGQIWAQVDTQELWVVTLTTLGKNNQRRVVSEPYNSENQIKQKDVLENGWRENMRILNDYFPSADGDAPRLATFE